MPALICNLPSYHVWVRKEYLTDHKSGHGEFVEGYWVSCKSIPGRAFYFETYLPDYAAMYDKLPISAFVSSPELPEPDMELHNLQFWNCMDYGVVAVQKQFVGSMHYEIMTFMFWWLFTCRIIYSIYVLMIVVKCTDVCSCLITIISGHDFVVH